MIFEYEWVIKNGKTCPVSLYLNSIASPKTVSRITRKALVFEYDDNSNTLS